MYYIPISCITINTVLAGFEPRTFCFYLVDGAFKVFIIFTMI